MVKAGDLLVVIDPRPYQAALDQIAGQLKHDEAALANAKVDLDGVRKADARLTQAASDLSKAYDRVSGKLAAAQPVR